MADQRFPQCYYRNGESILAENEDRADELEKAGWSDRPNNVEVMLPIVEPKPVKPEKPEQLPVEPDPPEPEQLPVERHAPKKKKVE